MHIEGVFSHAAWLAGLAGGRSFITNGPALYLSVNGAGPGDNLLLTPWASVDAEITWESPCPIESVELIHDGRVIAGQSGPIGSRFGSLRARATVTADGWLAARLSGRTRASFWQPVFAHTSPVWLTRGATGSKAGVAAHLFVRALDDAMLWVETSGRFHDARQLAEVRDLYRAGRAAYTDIAGRAGWQD